MTTDMPGMIINGAARVAVRVRNVSIAGAMIEAAPTPEDGDTLLFDCALTGEVGARVVWVLGSRCGLMFDAIVRLRTELAA